MCESSSDGSRSRPAGSCDGGPSPNRIARSNRPIESIGAPFARSHFSRASVAKLRADTRRRRRTISCGGRRNHGDFEKLVRLHSPVCVRLSSARGKAPDLAAHECGAGVAKPRKKQLARRDRRDADHAHLATARSSCSLSILTIVIIACMALPALTGSGSAIMSIKSLGSICHDTPN